MHSLNLITLIFCSTLITYGSCLLEGLYCGKENCYDVLKVTRDSSKQEIAKAYRNLARKYHPDLHKTDEAKKEAETNFKRIATAYEILKDDEYRTDYDYMLDNPEEYYAHYYRYYRRRVAPKVDVRIVLIVTISIISIIQYYSGWQRYESAIRHFSTIPKYRNKALEMAQDEIMNKLNKKGKNHRIQKSEKKEELEKIIRKIIEEKMDIQGAYAKPKITDILWIQLIILPYTIITYIYWYLKWIWNHDILKKPYNEEEQLYLIRKNLKMGVHQFNALEDEKKLEFLELELWKKDKFDVWKKEQEDEMKKQLAENPRYKQYRRYLKNHGPSRLTFED